MTTSRVKRYSITPEMFPLLFEDGLTLQVIKGIPRGAKFRGYAIDPERNSVMLFVEHWSFDIVNEGFVCPNADPIEVRRIYEARST